MLKLKEGDQAPAFESVDQSHRLAKENRPHRARLLLQPGQKSYRRVRRPGRNSSPEP